MTAPRLAKNYRLVEFDEIGSTNEEAKRFAASGAEDGTLIWAHCQTAGRGRRGREWASTRGNLFLSMVLRPACAPLQAAQLTFVAALAVRDMLSIYIGNHESIACKWPNDVLVEGRKISGILLESSTAGSGIVEWLVLGVGINLRHHPDIGGRHPATSLYAEGAGEVDNSAALEHFVEAFSRRRGEWLRGGFEATRESWLAHAFGIGRSANIAFENDSESGIFTGIDDDGALRLRGKDGVDRLFSAGDVTFEGSG